MPQVTLYYDPITCALAPFILLREAGVEFETVRPRRNNDEFAEELRQINPKMRIPILLLDGEVITEVPAVSAAIAGLVPAMHLMGRRPLDTIRVYEWMNWLSGTLHVKSFGPLFRPHRYSDDPAAFEGIQAKAMESIKDCFNFIEDKLTNVYAVGGNLTVVDPLLFVFYRWGNNGAGLKMKETYPKYTALVANLVQRAAVKATLKDEDLESIYKQLE
jgi:glutathione S-transferase